MTATEGRRTQKGGGPHLVLALVSVLNAEDELVLGIGDALDGALEDHAVARLEMDGDRRISGEVSSPTRLARALQAAMNGSLLNWAIHREGSLRNWIRRDLRTALAPYRAKRRA